MSTSAPPTVQVGPSAMLAPEQPAVPRARVPADVEREDRLLAGLTARQVLIVAVAGLVAYAGWWGCRAWLPILAYAPVGLVVVAVAFTVAVGRRDGLSLDRWLLAAARHGVRPGRLVPAPAGVDPLPDWVEPAGDRLPAPLRLPAHAVDPAGVIDLGAEGLAQVCAASPVNLTLRSAGEQQALLDAFARFLHATSGPVQVLIRSRRVDTTAMVARLRQHAGGLASPALEAAAIGHAAFLAKLAERHDLLDRRTFLILRQPPGPQAGQRLARRVQDAVTGLAACQVTLTVLDRPAVWELLVSTCDPDRATAGTPAPRAVPGEPIRFQDGTR